MAPVLAITGMVARTSMLEPFDPVGEISKPFVTGPNRIPISAEENRDDDRQNAVAEPEREKGTGAAAARGEPRPGGGPSPRRGDRCGQWCALRGGATGARSETCAPIRVLHSRFASVSRLVAELRSEDGGPAVDRSVLDPLVRHFGRTRLRGLPGQRAAHQEPAGTQE